MTAASDHDPPYSFNFDEVIEVSEHTLLMVEIVDHPNLGEVIKIKQYLKGQRETSELGTIFIPLNKLSLSALQTLMDYCEDKIRSVGTQSILARFFTQSLAQASIPNPVGTPKQSLPFTIGNYSGAEVTPERLQEKIADTSFNLEDVVVSLQKNQPFSQQL